VKRFTITFLNYDGTELQKSDWAYGSTPIYSGSIPTKEKSAQYSYVWKEWSPAIAPVSAEATYTAVFDTVVNKFVITFLNYDGTELQKSDWAYGSTPVYSGSTPMKAEDANNAYSFSGWTPEITSASESTTYTAVFTPYSAGFVFSLNSDNKSYGVANYTGSATAVIMPSEYNGLPVTAILDSAFLNCTAMTSLAIGDSIASIGEKAFSKCTGLASFSASTLNSNYQAIDDVLYSKDGKTIVSYPMAKSGSSYTIPDSVLTIGNYAFYECKALTSLAIPNSVITIGDYAFFWCYGLTTLQIGSSVQSIGSHAFGYCRAFFSLTIPDSVASIGTFAFYNCQGLSTVTIGNCIADMDRNTFLACVHLASFSVASTNSKYQSIGGVLYNKDATTLLIYPSWAGTSYTIPSSVTSINAGAFDECTSLKMLTIPSSVTSIGADAFNFCTSLTTLSIPSAVTIINDSTFKNCKHLTSISLPDSITSIGDSAFSGCTGLTSFTVGNAVTSIGSEALAYCSGLTTLTLGGTLTSIGSSAFVGCSALTSFSVAAENTVYQSVEGVLFSKDGKALMAYPASKEGSSYTIPNGVTSLADGAFMRASKLTMVTIPSSVTSIAGFAFSSCSLLQSINLPSGLTSISNYTFDSCSALTSISLPSTLTSIGKNAFSYCKALTTINLPSILTSIGERAFYDCEALTAISLPDSLTSIGEYAFGLCYAFKTVFIPASVLTMGSSAFFFGFHDVTISCGATSKPSGWASDWNPDNHPVTWGATR